MKRGVLVLLTVAVVLCMTACSGDDKEKEQETVDDGTYEVAMIIESKSVNDGGFNQATWKSIQKFSGERDLSCNYYASKEASTDSYLESVKGAIDKGAKLVIFSGSDFEVAAYKAQTLYPETCFLTIDGVPHSEKGTYATKENTISITFAEEESGFLAGYAAVRDGYKRIGFIGGKDVPAVKRYGYGFVQGAAAAAEELAGSGDSKKIQLKYMYTGTFDESEDVKAKAQEWYKDGTQVIFACGGAMNKSVIAAAEGEKGKVIGFDTNQSSMSDTVITSAEKNISPAVENVLRDFAAGKFVGGMAFNYAAKNDGVKLDMKSGKFNSFAKDDYNKIFRQLKNGKIKLEKDTEVKSVKELLGDYIVLNQ